MKKTGRQEARAKAWETWKKNLLQYSMENPEFSIADFVIQRGETAFHCWREARIHERNREFGKARVSYLKASECLEQAEKLMEHPGLPPLLEKLKNEYFEFAVNRDPKYREVLPRPLMWIKNNPGVLQTDIYKTFPDHKKEDLTYAFYFAEKEGLIRREKKGRSYQLFFLRDKEDAPILKLEDDEYDKQENAATAETLSKGCMVIFACVFWLAALVISGALGGLVGAIIVMVVFVLWVASMMYMRKTRNKKASPPAVKE